MSPMFVPGPVDVDPEVLAAQARPMLPHRSKEFEAIFHKVEEQTRRLFYTDQRVFITASSGSGLQEAAVRNFANQRLLCCVNGAFASRWYEVALANGKQAEKLEFSWEEPVSPEAVAEALRGKGYEAVTIVHNETSTGLENPVQDIAAAARDASPDTLICIDAVSSLAGARLEMDTWGLDMVLTSSQKCLALPPGLGLAAVSERALAYAEKVQNRGWYFDLVRLEKHRLKDSTPATPAMSLIFALERQLERIFAEGLEERFERHLQMAERVQSWALDRGMKLFAPEGYRSKTVTTVVNENNIDISDLNKYLSQRDMRIANGYGALKGKTFRIAHMGEIQMQDLERLMETMDLFMQERSS
jgi:predicted phosphoserine aminotransferase